MQLVKSLKGLNIYNKPFLVGSSSHTERPLTTKLLRQVDGRL